MSILNLVIIVLDFILNFLTNKNVLYTGGGKNPNSESNIRIFVRLVTLDFTHKKLILLIIIKQIFAPIIVIKGEYSYFLYTLFNS